MSLSSSSSSSSSASPQQLVVCAVQVDLRPECETPLVACHGALALLTRAAASLPSSSIDLFVLPELAPVGYSEDTFAKYLPTTQTIRDIYVKMEQACAETARQLQAHICYGTMGWKERSDGSVAYSIRQQVVGPNGQVVAVYDKIHLCDYGDCAETRFFTAGPYEPVSFDVKGFRIGIIICADM